MNHKLNELSKLDYDQVVEIAESILICKELPHTKDGIIDIILNHQLTFGQSEVIAALSLVTGDFVLQPIQVPSFHSETRIAWCKIQRCYLIDADDNNIINFFKGYENVFLTNQSPIELVGGIQSKMVYIEMISSLAAGNKTINCQTIVRAKVLPNFKFVRQVLSIPRTCSVKDEAF